MSFHRGERPEQRPRCSSTGAARRWRQKVPAPCHPARTTSAHGAAGRAREATGRSASRCDGRKRGGPDRPRADVQLTGRGCVRAPPAGPSRRRPQGSSKHRNSQVEGARKQHCKGDHVPTLRPLLAVTGPPRQYGPKPCSTWPLAGLQRPRPLHLRRRKQLKGIAPLAQLVGTS